MRDSRDVRVCVLSIDLGDNLHFSANDLIINVRGTARNACRDAVFFGLSGQNGTDTLPLI